MAFKEKYMICEGAHEALEDIIDNVIFLSTNSKETNIFPAFECLMKEVNHCFIKDLLKTAATIAKSKLI